MANSNAKTGFNWLFFMCVICFFLFMGLKLAEVGQVATWSWWWVTAPLWMYFGAILAFVLVIIVIMLIALLLGYRPND